MDFFVGVISTDPCVVNVFPLSSVVETFIIAVCLIIVIYILSKANHKGKEEKKQ